MICKMLPQFILKNQGNTSARNLSSNYLISLWLISTKQDFGVRLFLVKNERGNRLDVSCKDAEWPRGSFFTTGCLADGESPQSADGSPSCCTNTPLTWRPPRHFMAPRLIQWQKEGGKKSLQAHEACTIQYVTCSMRWKEKCSESSQIVIWCSISFFWLLRWFLH